MREGEGSGASEAWKMSCYVMVVVWEFGFGTCVVYKTSRHPRLPIDSKSIEKNTWIWSQFEGIFLDRSGRSRPIDQKTTDRPDRSVPNRREIALLQPVRACCAAFIHVSNFHSESRVGFRDWRACAERFLSMEMQFWRL